MKRMPEPLVVLTVIALLTLLGAFGFGFGYFNGHDQGMVEAKEDLFLHSGHRPEPSMLLLFLDAVQFRLSTVVGWALISTAGMLIVRRQRAFHAWLVLGGALMVFLAALIVFTAESWEFWSDSFRWSSPLGRVASVIHYVSFLGILIFGYGLIRVVSPNPLNGEDANKS